VNVDSLPQSSYPSSPPKDRDSTLTGLHHLGNFKFITDYFDGLSLSPRQGDSGTAFMGPTCCGASPLWQAMTEDSTKEFLTNTPLMESTLSIQATTMVPLRTMVLRVEVDLPFERHHAHHGG
jgi:hypothetical protein